ncbi:hypothetical protein CHS0354_013109 [Potamilus streckersoni]|uniref:Fe2OG dioxygenase domain-containing protein n=1 Tax=Potamilus streckersoni TaxID=2493646 RepID=A0AAE0S7V0_9BIVA|nr:hypothetical protein CHS0354_013109 [Potamilus streckersoni]
MANINIKTCACKGIRYCLLCGNITNDMVQDRNVAQTIEIHNYCPDCHKAWPALDLMQHPSHQGDGFEFEGIFLWTDFITEVEEQQLCQQIDQTPFVDSQSGRRKQDFGPKVNFKKRKLKCDDFSGLPNYSKALYVKMTTNSLLHDFIPVELCNLEYMPERGSAIDPHFDDFWLWGERLVTLNLLSDSYLCMTCDEHPNMEVHIPMPRRSLLVVHGPARYKWKHSIHRKDISGRRLAMTFRELSDEFRGQGTQSEMGQKLINIAFTFKGIAVG